MYTRLSSNKTKHYYRKLLNDTMAIINQQLRKQPNELWTHIEKQLEDIKKNVVLNNNVGDWEDIFDRYDIGSLAVQLFQEEDEIQARLCDAFSGAVHYNEMDE